MNWNTNTKKLVAKANQRMFFIRKLKSFSVCNDILFLFYQSVIQSIITSCIIVWYGNLRAQDIRKLERVTKVASKTIGLDVKTVRSIFETAIVSKLRAIMQNPTHPLHDSVVVNRSGRIRPLPPKQSVLGGRFYLMHVTCLTLRLRDNLCLLKVISTRF